MTNFTRNEVARALGSEFVLGQEPGIPTSLTLGLIASGVGLGVGFWGYANRKEPLGQIALGAGGSMLAAGLVILLSEAL